MTFHAVIMPENYTYLYCWSFGFGLLSEVQFLLYGSPMYIAVIPSFLYNYYVIIAQVYKGRHLAVDSDIARLNLMLGNTFL